MTLIWLLSWLVSGHPGVHEWNGWAVALVVTIVIDVLSKTGARS
jgi:hypothetical protein